VGSQTRRPQHRLRATNSHQVAGTSRLHGGVAGKSATYSNQAPTALGLEAWRTGVTLLETTQASREVRVDSRARSSSRSGQGFPIQTASPHGSSQKEQLLLYLAATTHLVSSAIVVER
jgi:hypothetical protein